MWRSFINDDLSSFQEIENKRARQAEKAKVFAPPEESAVDTAEVRVKKRKLEQAAKLEAETVKTKRKKKRKVEEMEDEDISSD